MDVDAQEEAITEHTPTTPQATVQDSSTVLDGHDASQTNATHSSQANTPSEDASGIGSGATPPPHLDPMREERERARRQILEALGAAMPSSSTPEPVTTTDTEAQAPSAASQSASDSQHSPVASATLSALLDRAAARTQAGAAAGLGESAGSSSSPPATAAPEPASSARSETQQQPQQAQQSTGRVPLQPEMISGTSMVVQGALLARTIANRPSPSGTSPSSASQAAAPSAGADGSSSVSAASAATVPPSDGTAGTGTHANLPRGTGAMERQSRATAYEVQ